MSWYPASTLIAFLINFSLTLLVYWRSKKRRDFILFANMLAMASVWLFFAYFVNVAKTPHEGLLWNRLLHIGAIMVVPTFFHFAWTFAKTEKLRKFSFIVPINYAVSALLLIFLFTPLLINGVEKTDYVGYSFSTGPLYNIYLALFAFSAIVGLLITRNAYKISVGLKKQRAKYVLFCLTLAVASAFFFFLLAITSPLKIPPIDNLISILFSISLTYSILTYRLVEIRVIFAKIFLILAFSFVFLLFYTAVSSFLFFIFFKRFDYTPIVIATIPFALIFILIPVLRQGLLLHIDKIIYGSDYDYSELVNKVSNGLVALLDLREILGFLTDTIDENLKPEHLGLFLKEDNDFTIKSTTSFISSRQRIVNKNALVIHLQKTKLPILGWTIDGTIAEDKKILSTMKRLHAQIAVPLIAKDRLTGFLTLDNKRNGKNYSPQDIKVLYSIATTAAIALQNSQLYEEAITDGLTGLYHHKYFQNRITEELNRSKRYLHPLSLIMLDIDYFKKINDTYGHQIGDQVLKELANELKANLRLFDIVARYGGEEFSILIPSIREEDIKSHFNKTINIAERVRASIEERTFTDRNIKLTASLGVAVFDGKNDKMDVENIIKAADKQLYKAKQTGRNKICKISKFSKKPA